MSLLLSLKKKEYMEYLCNYYDKISETCRWEAWLDSISLDYQNSYIIDRFPEHLVEHDKS